MASATNFLDERKTNFSQKNDFIQMLQQCKIDIMQQVFTKGAVYFPDSPLRSQEDFKQAVLSVNEEIAEYTGAKVRQNQGDRLIYSPTSTPKNLINFLHHEMAYQQVVPEGLALFCQTASPVGGDSLLADSRTWYNEISLVVKKELEDRKLLFQRVLVNRSKLQNYLSRHFDAAALLPSWQGNFECESRIDAEAKAQAMGHDVRWTNEGHMLLLTKIDPVRSHPVTGEKMWVNNAHLFQLNKQVYGQRLYYAFKTYFLLTGRPMTTCFFGDGEKIPDSHTADILNASLRAQNTFKLRPGCLIFINNYTVAHGRLPFEGPRKLMFAMYKKLSAKQ